MARLKPRELPPVTGDTSAHKDNGARQPVRSGGPVAADYLYEIPVVKTKLSSRRRDYLYTLAFGNGLMVLAMIFLPRNPMTFVAEISGWLC